MWKMKIIETKLIKVRNKLEEIIPSTCPVCKKKKVWICKL